MNIIQKPFTTTDGKTYVNVPYDQDTNQWLYGKTIEEFKNSSYEELNKDNVFRYTEEVLEQEEFSFKEFFGIEDIEEFEKSGDIWG